MWLHFCVVLGMEGPPVITVSEIIGREVQPLFNCVILPGLLVFARIFWCKHCVMYAQLGIKLGNGEQ